MKIFKITAVNGRTREGMQWGENITHTLAACREPQLCSAEVIHAYESAEMAVIMRPKHVNYSPFALWEASGEIVVTDGLKCGTFELTTLREIDIPAIPLIQKVNFGIFCAQQVCAGITFIDWANKWLSGTDHSAASAYSTYRSYSAVASAAAASASAAVAASAYSAAAASAYSAASAASAYSYYSAYYSASAAVASAAVAAVSGRSINFKDLLKQAMQR